MSVATEPKPLTARQSEVLRLIRDSIRDRGYPPTYRELMDELGFASRNAITGQLRSLERKGFVRRDFGVSRGIAVLGGVGSGVEAERLALLRALASRVLPPPSDPHPNHRYCHSIHLTADEVSTLSRLALND